MAVRSGVCRTKGFGFSGLGFRLLITSALKAFFSVLSFVSECAGIRCKDDAVEETQ